MHDTLKELCTWRYSSAAGDRAGAKRVRWVHSYYTGVDAFDLKPIAECLEGVPMSNARGAFSTMLAEHALFATMYFNRQLWRLRHATRTWDRFPMRQNCGQKMAIVGYGDIGQAVGRLAAQGFGMRVTGVKSRPASDGASTDEYGVTLVHGDEALRRCLAEADFVVAVLPLTPQTKHMLRLEHFRLMRKDAVFINIGRGASIVEDDLVTAIQEGSILGAALDVFEHEPLPEASPLWRLPEDKLLLSPHNAVVSAHRYPDACQQFIDLARAFLCDGTLPQYLVDPHRGY